MSLQIIDPIPGKGRDKTHIERPDEYCDHCGQSMPYNDTHSIDLGLVVRNEAGESVKDQEVEITTTDKDQNVVLKGTGNTTRIPLADSDKKETVYVYMYHYEFKKSGKHKITFKVGDEIEVVTLDVLKKGKK